MPVPGPWVWRPGGRAAAAPDVPGPASRDLRAVLDRLCREFDPAYLWSDPLGLVRSFADPADREVAGLIAAVLAYGRVEGIRRTLTALFEVLGPRPRDRILDLDPRGPEARSAASITHRFNNGGDMVHLLAALKEALGAYGSLEALFLQGHDPAAPDVGPGLAAFSSWFRARAPRPGLPAPRAFAFLFPSPEGGSACKRLNLFLRWMVRPDNGLDLGIWRGVRPAQLVVPLDTHVFELARRLGWTRRSSADWRAALEVTDRLRELDPEDPVRYDFALARPGILGRCSAPLCRGCPLEGACASGEVRETRPEGRSRGSAPGRPRPGRRRRHGGTP